MRIALVTWAERRPSGGNAYNAGLVDGLRALGVDVAVHRLTGAWPHPTAQDRLGLAATLRDTPVAVVDGIVACAAPDEVRAAVASGSAVAVLVHMPLAAGRPSGDHEARRLDSLERRALAAAHRVVVPSHHAAADLRRRYGLTDVRVATPGARRAPLARGGAEVPGLVYVATLVPDKGQLTFVRALAAVADLPWTARLVGSTVVDHTYSALVRAGVADSGLADRVQLTGELVGEDLEQQWDRSDLLVLASRHETFGLVVTEALARGIPAVVGAGTGAAEALAGTTRPPSPPSGSAAPSPGELPGTAVPPGDAEALAVALRGWLADPRLRSAWRERALHRRSTLPDWTETARAVLAALR